MVRMGTSPPDLGEGSCPRCCSRKGDGRWGLPSFSLWRAVSPASGFPRWNLGQSRWEIAPSAPVYQPPTPLGFGTRTIPPPSVTVESLPAPARSWGGPPGPAQGYCFCLSLRGPGGGGGLHQMRGAGMLSQQVEEQAWLCRQTWV